MNNIYVNTLQGVDLEEVKNGKTFFITEAYAEDSEGHKIAGDIPVIITLPTAEFFEINDDDCSC